MFVQDFKQPSNFFTSGTATAGNAGQITTEALGEEGGSGLVTTQAVGEEGGSLPPITTLALGEEGGDPILPVRTQAVKDILTRADANQNGKLTQQELSDFMGRLERSIPTLISFGGAFFGLVVKFREMSSVANFMNKNFSALGAPDQNFADITLQDINTVAARDKNAADIS